MKRDLLLKKIVLIALLSGLCTAATYTFKIPMPAGDFIHLGNFVMIISALLLGGVAGGLVGSLGMGLYDIIFYISKPTTVARTFVLKFIVGFMVGFIFDIVIRKKYKVKPLLISMLAFCSIVFIVTISIFAAGDFSSFGANNNFSSELHNILGSEKSFKMTLFIPVLAFVFAGLNLTALCIEPKLKQRSKAALIAVTVAVLVNILGEFFLRWLLEGLFLDGFDVSIVVATSKIPGSLLTGFISIALAALVYEPIYKALVAVNLIEDKDLLEEEANEEANEALENTEE